MLRTEFQVLVEATNRDARHRYGRRRVATMPEDPEAQRRTVRDDSGAQMPPESLSLEFGRSVSQRPKEAHRRTCSRPEGWPATSTQHDVIVGPIRLREVRSLANLFGARRKTPEAYSQASTRTTVPGMPWKSAFSHAAQRGYPAHVHRGGGITSSAPARNIRIRAALRK
jgi:hypothetical protein